MLSAEVVAVDNALVHTVLRPGLIAGTVWVDLANVVDREVGHRLHTGRLCRELQARRPHIVLQSQDVDVAPVSETLNRHVHVNRHGGNVEHETQHITSKRPSAAAKQ